MSVSLRVTGTWAELTADGTVAIPATPQAGDRMYLFARWKDFSITATVANWTELTEFADGSVSSGNGTGSVKVGCWYRDWQAGDTDPTIDFSASPTNASVVIMVMQKGATDVWDTPVARTAAMTNWTTTSQSVSASATVDARGGGVVMGLIGIRDDSAVMTRPTNGIDDAGGLVTWNGNYVESPATHHSTTTGDDGAADLGYRLVTTGATGATLRMTGTISAAETGTALWVVQGVSTVVTPGIATLTASQFAPLLLLVVGPAAATLTLTGFASHLQTAITPASVPLSTTQFAPQLRTQVTPSNAALIVTTTAPQLQQALTPPATALGTTLFAPVLDTRVSPASIIATLTTLSPAVTQSTTITVPSVTLSLVPALPHVLPYKPTFIDPGGDAIQGIGYFQTQVLGSGGIISFDTVQKVNGVGSYKFDSDDGDSPHVTVAGVMSITGIPSTTRRVSTWFRYNSVPDATDVVTVPVEGSSDDYSGEGFVDFQPRSETAFLVGTITVSGNAIFTITSALVTGSPLAVPVAVLVDDMADAVATKAAAALNANAAISEHFIASSASQQLILTAKPPGLEDPTLNIAYTNDTCAGLVPDATSDDTGGNSFGDLNAALSSNDGTYGHARPDRNAGQGAVYGSLGLASGTSGLIPNEAEIKSVKIRYERKYDTDTSIGISRVKWRIDGVEGPNHDNTDIPLTDTVVEVDITGDRDSWARSELADGVFEVIAEARRGDTDTEHTQSWDYVEVEVEYFIPFSIIGPSGNGLAFEVALVPHDDHVTLRLIDGDKVWYDGITQLLPDTDHRISWGHLLHDTDLIDIKLYVDGIEELSIEDAKCLDGIENLVNLLYGWVSFVGVNKVCWFDQLYIDDGNDLADCGNMLSTAKLPATVNEDNWDTTGGTGAVNERPLSETNYKEHSTPIDSQYQTYNLQAAATGDIDISSESLVGYMGWAWAKTIMPPDTVRLITNGAEVSRLDQMGITPKFIRLAAASASYPSNARGIGMYVETEFGSLTMFECGVVVAYEGPGNPGILLPWQKVRDETLDTIVDDLRADPPDSYELCCKAEDFDGSVQIDVYSLDQDGGSLQQQPSINLSGGGQTRLRITAGVEVRLDVTVVGVTMLAIWRRLNVD